MGTGTRSTERVRRQGVVPTYSPRRHVSVPTGAASSLGENARGYRERFLDGGRRELGRNAMTNGAFGDNAVGRTYWIRKKFGESVPSGTRSAVHELHAHMAATKERAGFRYFRGMGSRASRGTLKKPGSGPNGLPWHNDLVHGDGAFGATDNLEDA
ncbi:hypothetical protein NFJ02_26g61720 [Pycnococcus provasolii]